MYRYQLIEHLNILVKLSEWLSDDFFICRFFLHNIFFTPCRLNNARVQNEFLRQIPRMAEITVPTNYLDWKSKQLSLPINVRGAQITNSPGRRDRSFTAEEPNYVLVRGDDANPHLGITWQFFI